MQDVAAAEVEARLAARDVLVVGGRVVKQGAHAHLGLARRVPRVGRDQLERDGALSLSLPAARDDVVADVIPR